MAKLNLEYQGHFFLPPGRRTATGIPPALAGSAKFGYGGKAMCLGAEGDTLWVSGSDQGDLVAAVEIPAEPSATARVVRSFRELTPRADVIAADLDTLVGVAEYDGDLWGLWQDGYDVDGKDGGRVSLWDGTRLVQAGDGKLKAHAGYLTAHGGALWCGRSHGAGNADVQHGPALYGYRPGDEWDLSTFKHFPIAARNDWTEADRYTGLVFPPGCVCWVVSKDIVPRQVNAAGRTVHPWYGGPVGPNGEEDVWNKNKGYHTEVRQVWLIPYTWPGLEPLPPQVLGEFHVSAKCGGVAYDAKSGRLYVHELWPPEKTGNSYPWESPRIHVYEVVADEPEPAPEPEPEREAISVDILIDGDRYTGELERTDD